MYKLSYPVESVKIQIKNQRCWGSDKTENQAVTTVAQDHKQKSLTD